MQGVETQLETADTIMDSPRPIYGPHNQVRTLVNVYENLPSQTQTQMLVDPTSEVY